MQFFRTMLNFVYFYIISFCFLNVFCENLSSFKIKTIEETKVYLKGFIIVKTREYNNYYFVIDKLLLHWFSKIKSKICFNQGFDTNPVELEFHLSEISSKAVTIQEINTCCKL